MNKPKVESSQKSHLVRGTGIVSILTLLSRFFGFLRDLLVARLLGSSALADSFFVAFRIPNLLRSFVAEGALSAAFVPIFTHELPKGKEHARYILSEVCGFLIVVTIILSIVFIIFAEQIVLLIAPGFKSSQHFEICVELTQIMMPYILCISLVAMLNGALNSIKIFGVSAAAQIIMNLVLILGAVVAGFYESLIAVKILAISVILGGIAQVIWQVPALKRAGLTFQPTLNLRSPIISELVKLMSPALLGATVYQISQFINTLLASLLISGSISWIFYADRLTQLPIGVFTIALASVLLPTLSSAKASGDTELFQKSLLDSLRYTSFIIIPISFYLFFFAEPLIRIIFERGAFDTLSTHETSNVVKAYAVGLWAVSCHTMLARAFLAYKDTTTSVIVGIFSLTLSVIFSLLFMGKIAPLDTNPIISYLSQAQTAIAILFGEFTLGAAGLALSSSLAAFFSFSALAILLKKKIQNLAWIDFFVSTLKITLSCCLAFSILIPHLNLFKWSDWHIIPLTAVCILIYLTCAYLFKMKEFLECWSIIKRKFRAQQP